jgi:hypothetical protein
VFETKGVEKNHNTHFMFSDFFPRNPAIYEIMWKNMVRTTRASGDNTAHVRFMLDN